MISILIVDDDEEMCETLSDILEVKGYSTHTAFDGYKALDIVGTEKVDVMLMDIMMPKINGVETFKKVKKLDKGISVIMITAYAVDELINEVVDTGAFNVIYKPLDIDELVDNIVKAGPQQVKMSPEADVCDSIPR